MSVGVNIKFSSNSISSSKILSRIVFISTTVGIPIDITSVSIVFLLISPLLLFIPLPGWIPVSVIWIVLFNLSIADAQSESITMIKSGFTLAMIPIIAS